MDEKSYEFQLLTAEIYDTLMLEAECPLSGEDCEIISDLMIRKGYRRKQDVAREIFERIKEKARGTFLLSDPPKVLYKILEQDLELIIKEFMVT